MSGRSYESLVQHMVACRQRGLRGESLGLRGRYTITPLVTFVETVIRDSIARQRAASERAAGGEGQS